MGEMVESWNRGVVESLNGGVGFGLEIWDFRGGTGKPRDTQRGRAATQFVESLNCSTVEPLNRGVGFGLEI